MADILISTAKVYLSGGGASGYGSVPVPTAEQITNAEAAIDAMSVDIDTLLSTNVTVYLVPQSFFTANGWSSGGDSAWGFTPVAGKAFVNNGLGLPKQRYGILHEIGHTIDMKGVMNHAKRATVGALMVPAPDQSATGWWGAGNLHVSPNENFADSIPRAYAGTGDMTGGYYTRPIPAASYATFRSTVGGAGTAASTTLAANATAGAINIRVASITGLNAGDWIRINDVESQSITTVGSAGAGGSGLTLDMPLTGSYTTGQSVVETSASSDVSSGDIHITRSVTTANGQLQSVTFTGLARLANGHAKLRFYDGQAWGPYSDLADVFVRSDLGPPINITVSPGTEPDIGFSIDSYPGDTIYGYTIIITQDQSGGRVILWNHTEEIPLGGSTRQNIHYGGAPLEPDQLYMGSLSYINSFGDESPNALFTFVPHADAGAVVTYGGASLNLSYKINTVTPTFSLAQRGGGNIDEAQLRAWYGDRLLYDTGLVGPFTPAAFRNLAIPPGYLVPGINIEIEGRVRLSGNSTPGVYSERATVHINATPGAPTPVTVRSDKGEVIGPGSDIYRRVGRTDDVWVSSVDDPIIVFPYRDVDRDLGYIDNPTRREVELRDMSNNHVGASPYVITSGITDEWAVPSGLLDPDTTFKARADYDDNANVRGAFSEYAKVRYSEPPVISNVTPAGSVLTDPTPSFTWDFTSAAGKPQKTAQLYLYLDDALLWDHRIISSSRYIDVPTGVLDTGQAISYVLVVRDSDGLSASAFGTFTTAFTVPDALTGLTLTPDLDSDAIDIEWTASTDPVFEAYNVYMRTFGKNWALVRRITDVDTNFLTLYAAPRNKEVFIRVVQTNGWRESDPSEGSTTLGGERDTAGFLSGYALIRPERIVDLRFAFASPGDTQTDLEWFSPPNRRDVTGRREKVPLLWGTTGYEGSLTFFDADREVIDTLREWKEDGLISILKSEYGAVRYVRLTSTPDAEKPAGSAEGQLAYTEQLPAEF